MFLQSISSCTYHNFDCKTVSKWNKSQEWKSEKGGKNNVSTEPKTSE